jgi:DNA invertase Pin-like site-specific DNA recombinase
MKRRVIRPDARLVQEFVYTQQQLPTHRPIVQYIRQSTTKQLKRNKQSYELQDSDLRRRLVQGYGWQDNDKSIIKIDADQGKSGTKRRDERTGLDQLYALLEQGKAGAIAAFDVSRLYRVTSKAEIGTFCDMVLKLQVPIVTFARIYWPTSTDNDQLQTDLKAAGAFIEEIIKGKLIAAKNRHIEYDFSYGGNFVPFGFTVVGIGDEQADRKFYQKYRPHSELIRYLFRRFKELGGNLPLLARELEQTDFRFPPFEKGITARVAMRADSDGSYPLRNRQTIISILTNRAYIGWYVYGGMLVSKTNHEAIVPIDEFTFAYESLMGTTIDGEPLEERKARERRYGGASALLDGVLRSGNAAVYVIDGRYAARPEVNGFPHSELVIPVQTLDEAFSTAMVAVLTALELTKQKSVSASLRTRIQALQQEQERQASDFTQALARIDREIGIATMDKRVSLEAGDEEGARSAAKQLAQLYRDRRAIEAKQQQASSEASELEECYDLLDCACKQWGSMPVPKRKRLIRLLGVNANLTALSPHFLCLEVELVSPVNTYLTLYLHRARGSRLLWSEEEDSILATLFPTADKQTIMEALPKYSWAAICWRGYERLGVQRSYSKKETLTYEDLQVIEHCGARTDRPVWMVTTDKTGQLRGARPGHGPLWSCIRPVQAL